MPAGENNMWLTIKEVCEIIGVSRSTLDDWRVKGRGPRFIRLPNGQLRIKRSEFELWLDGLQVA